MPAHTKQNKTKAHNLKNGGSDHFYCRPSKPCVWQRTPNPHSAHPALTSTAELWESLSPPKAGAAAGGEFAWVQSLPGLLQSASAAALSLPATEQPERRCRGKRDRQSWWGQSFKESTARSTHWPNTNKPSMSGEPRPCGIFKKTLEAIEYAECTELNEMRERHGTALYGVRLEAKGKETRLKIGLEASGRPQRRTVMQQQGSQEQTSLAIIRTWPLIGL